jgi:hypothetical protein
MQRHDRKGALVPYHQAIDWLVRRAIPANEEHEAVRRLAEMYDTDEKSVVIDMKKRLEKRN